MTTPLAIIPARIGSKGVPHKNWKPFAGGASCVDRAIALAHALGYTVVVSTDRPPDWGPRIGDHCLYRPAPLHTDTCPMIDVVMDALDAVPGPDDQIVVLLQPSTPTRRPSQVLVAVELLYVNPATSVVSVVEHNGRPMTYRRGFLYDRCSNARRQDYRPTYVRDGTVYAFRRSTVITHGTIYGTRCLPFVIPRWASVTIDTPDDWDEAERRLRVD